MILLRLSLILVAAALLSVARAEDSFIKGKPVVIVVGLPGDVESEQTFNDETTRLLQDLATQKPQKAILLSNDTHPWSMPTAFPLETLASNRDTFLALADRWKKEPASPCFFVFGHGGEEGDTPVFHVPGPRIKPDDMAAVAAACPASTWLLFFPGSGGFARALQAPQRSILATESGDTVFTSDPVSFGLLLNLLVKPMTLENLAGQLGAATRKWYADRSLARTEAPTLWVDENPPRELATADAPTSVAAASTPGSSSTNAPAAADTNSAPATAGAADNAAWKNIQPADPAKYPQSDAVTLWRHEADVIGDDNDVMEDSEIFIQVLTREGKRYGDFDFSFAPGSEDLNFLACEVKLPDGTIEQLDPDAIHDAASPEPGDYGVESRKIFSLPHLGPGAIIHIHLQRQWRRFPLPYVFRQIFLASDMPTAALKVEMTLSSKLAFHFRITHHDSVDPAVTQTQYGSHYAWDFRDLPAVVDEPLAPAEPTPSLVVSTFPDWATFSNWYYRLIRQSDVATPELAAQARDLVRDAKTDREKVRAITEFVTGFRYVAVPLGVNSFRPHAAVNVWRNHYGDCKDKANLLDTMLGAVGIKAGLVLVPRFSQAYDDLPGFAFNHAISKVELGNESLWVDSTDDVCRFGLLPPGDPGRKVLVVGPETDALSQLPEAKASDHGISLETTLRFADAADPAPQAQISATTRGYGDYMLRADAKEAGAHSIAPLLAASFSPAAGIFQPKEQAGTSVSDLDQSFSWKADGAWPGLLGRLPDSPVRLLRLPGWLPKEWPVAMLPRTTPLHLNQGYPMQITESFRLHLPPGAAAVKLPKPQEEKGAPLAWKISWAKGAGDEIDAKLEMSLVNADLSMDETRQFQTGCQHLLDALQEGLTFETP